jgi:serine O-acetyltransferase
MPDPVAYAINPMLDHIHSLDNQIKTMQKALNDAGINFTAPHINFRWL